MNSAGSPIMKRSWQPFAGGHTPEVAPIVRAATEPPAAQNTWALFLAQVGWREAFMFCLQNRSADYKIEFLTRKMKPKGMVSNKPLNSKNRPAGA
jgi:hypothetical protein